MQTASLAIMAKIELLFEHVVANPATFLSFIPVALPFDHDELRLMGSIHQDGDEARRALRAAADFAVLANYVPAVSSLWSQDGRLLWDAYAQVLGRHQVQVAQPRLTQGEVERLKAAEDLLNDRETGLPTSTYERYLELQEAYFGARERLAAARLTAEHSDDPDIAARARAEETRLIADVDAAMDLWRTRGARDDVDAALAVVGRLAGLGHEAAFQDAAERLNASRRTGVDPGVDAFYDTGYLPRGLFTTDAVWTKLDLDASEIDALTRTASQRRSDLEAFSNDDEEFEVRRLSLELGRAEVIRPWFDPNLLTSRSWRWRGDLPPLSDGGDPPAGTLPAYVTAMIFVRNLEIELVPGSARNARTIEHLQAGALTVLGNIVLQPVPSTMETATVARLTSARSGHHAHSLATFAARRSGASPAPAGSGSAAARTGSRPRPSSAATMARMFERSDVAAPPRRVAPSELGVARAIIGRAASSPGRVTGVGGPLPRVRDHRTGTASAGTWLRDLVRKTRPTERVPAQPANRGGMAGNVTSREAAGRAAAIEGARVSAIDEGGAVVRTVVTDRAGAYVLHLPSGRYGLEVASDGYDDHVESATITVGTRHHVRKDVSLLPTRAAPVTENRPGIQLVAVLCRALPKAPDPDPQLTWD